MNVANYTIRINTKAKYLFVCAVLALVSLICAAFSFTAANDFDLSRQQILLRKIGHEVLLHSGDSTSRVLPVQKVAENEYQLKFENDFTFQSDSLVRIISRSLAKENVAHNYIVNVLNCSDKAVIFGYAILKNGRDNIVPCSGRKQPKSCYLINLKFENAGITSLQKSYLIGGIALLAFGGFMFSASVKNRVSKVDLSKAQHNGFEIGNTFFDSKKRQMITGEIVTEFTVKENKLFQMFAQAPNEIIERSRIQKEIWEDEGVIVGRSLDMFISKLRKKLEIDPSIQLLNVHGKGYKLQVSEACL